MDTPVAEVAVPFIFFAATFGIVYVVVNAQHRQRMAMIEKGMDMGSLRNREVPLRSLRNGLVMIGAGLGLFLGHLMSINMPTLNDEGRFEHSPLPYFIMVLLCSGLALVTHHFIARREEARKG
ncbi:MAG: hypothetical protein H6591_12135 [Flavobacteriales bacterium]|nr:hypothetical protein [Flavobacteriales bacterium]